MVHAMRPPDSTATPISIPTITPTPRSATETSVPAYRTAPPKRQAYSGRGPEHADQAREGLEHQASGKGSHDHPQGTSAAFTGLKNLGACDTFRIDQVLILNDQDASQRNHEQDPEQGLREGLSEKPAKTGSPSIHR